MTALTARFDQGDGTDLRHLRAGSEQLAERIYVAIRDEHWWTAPLEVLTRELVERPDGFTLRATLRSGWDHMPVDATVEYLAAGDTLTARFAATAHGSFRYNRIGFCILHPLDESLGQPLTVTTADGTVHESRFPEAIEPQHYVDGLPVSMLPAFTGMRTVLPSGRTLAIALRGDEFEIEDQRNWSDASFKTYGTPLHRGFPMPANAGQVFAQELVFTASGSGAAPEAPSTPALRVGERVGTLPFVGLDARADEPGTWRPASGFPDLNRSRPAPESFAGVSAVAFGVNSSVHADDRWSVLESTATHGTIARQARALIPEGMPLRLGPFDFQSPAGEWLDDVGAFTDPPQEPSTHPLRGEPFGAAYLVASVASVAASGAAVAALGYFDPSLEHAPAGRIAAWLADLAGAPTREVTVPQGIAALALDGPRGVELALANTAAQPRELTLPDGARLALGVDEVVTRTLPG